VEQFIDLRALARVKDLALVARAVATGFLQGLHESELRGVGIEFSQYRSYEPGDAPSRIDWKLFARSDRYFVREAERESDISLWLVLDASDSMALCSEGGVWSKFEYGRHLVATLAYLAIQQGDQVGLLLVNGSESQVLPPLGGMRQWYRLVNVLEQAATSGTVASSAELMRDLVQLRQSGLIVWVTDLYQYRTEIESAVKTLVTSRNEVAVLQLENTDEIRFPFQGAVRFEDLETGEQVVANAAKLRKTYLAARADWQRAWELALGRSRISVDRINVDEPLDESLMVYLRRRGKAL